MGKRVFRERERRAALSYFGLGFWNSVCSEGWVGTQEFEICDQSGNELVQYMEDISKTNNGGSSHLRIKSIVVQEYKNLTNVERCPVEL